MPSSKVGSIIFTEASKKGLGVTSRRFNAVDSHLAHFFACRIRGERVPMIVETLERQQCQDIKSFE